MRNSLSFVNALDARLKCVSPRLHASLRHQVVAKRVVNGLRMMLDARPACLDPVVFDDDVYLVSYPKSGNTWMRFILGNIRYPDAGPTTFENVHERIPSLYELSNSALSEYPRPRIIKSHDSYRPAFRKVIYLVRDPRDVAVSYYYYRLRVRSIPPDCSLAEFVQSFVLGTVDRFGPWGEHVGSWLGARNGGASVVVVRYEDMLADPVQQARTVSEWIRAKTDTETLRRSVELSSADMMRRSEEQAGSAWGENRSSRRDIRFVRSAKSGEWKEKLDGESVIAIENAWSAVMRQLGYPCES